MDERLKHALQPLHTVNDEIMREIHDLEEELELQEEQITLEEESIDQLILDLDGYAREIDPAALGLPLSDPTCRADLRDIIKQWLEG